MIRISRTALQGLAVLHGWDVSVPGVMSTFTPEDGPTFRITWTWNWDQTKLLHAALWQHSGLYRPRLVLVGFVERERLDKGQCVSRWVTEYGTRQTA